MSDPAVEYHENALEIIGAFLREVSGQGVSVLIELATGKDNPPAVRLNAALALTGQYDQFALEVAEAYGPEVTEEAAFEEFDRTFAEVDYDPEVDGPVTGTGEVIAVAPGTPTDSSDGEQTGLTPEEAAVLMEERAAAARQAAPERGSELGGDSGVGRNRNAKAAKRRRRHGR